MIWNIAAGVMLGIAPFFFFCCGLYTIVNAERHDRDAHWRTGIWLACGAGCVAAVMIKTLVGL